VNVIIVEPDDSIAQPTMTATVLRVAVDVDDAAGGASAHQTDETIVMLTTAIGFWAESGADTISLQCVIDDGAVLAEADVDPGDIFEGAADVIGISEPGVGEGQVGAAYDAEVEFEGVLIAAGEETAELGQKEEGCLGVDANLVIPLNAAAGTYAITALTNNGIPGVEHLVITSSTSTPTPTPTATATPACNGAIISGAVPPTGGFGMVVTNCGTISQVVAATGCSTATMALWITEAGAFLTYVPGTTVSAVNAEFLAHTDGANIPQDQAFVARCV
jgi:hypothetical protein